MSQDSQASSVQSELTDYQNEEFVNELKLVDSLYFLNSITEVEDESESTLYYDSDTSSSASDYESVVNVDPSDEDKSRYTKQAKFRNEACGCTEFYGKPCRVIVVYDEMINSILVKHKHKSVTACIMYSVHVICDSFHA